MRWMKRIFLTLSFLFISLFIFCNLWIVRSTKDRVFSDVNKVPHHRIALVLGTSHRTSKGHPNPFFEKRIETAAELYKRGKIDHLILSGDNRSIYYNEPMAMLKALLKKGVPASAITLDYAGLRTLDSIVRCKEIFGQDKFVIITHSSVDITTSMQLPWWRKNQILNTLLKSGYGSILHGQRLSSTCMF
jgi:SanA protein